MAQRRRSPTGFARLGGRRAVLTMAATSILAIGGVAVAGAIGTTGTRGVQPESASTPSTAVLTTAPSASASPAAVASAHATPSHTFQTSPRTTATAAGTASPCPAGPQRVAAARRLLQHENALPNVTLLTPGSRPGLLGDADAGARTISLYIRSCADEPTIQVAVIWAYEAGQFVPVETWGAAKADTWRRLRHSTGLASATQLRQDVASVFAFWQTGSTRYWQSPVAPPTASELSTLTPYLTVS